MQCFIVLLPRFARFCFPPTPDLEAIELVTRHRHNQRMGTHISSLGFLRQSTMWLWLWNMHRRLRQQVLLAVYQPLSRADCLIF